MLQFSITNFQLPMNYQFSITDEAANGKWQMANVWSMAAPKGDA